MTSEDIRSEIEQRPFIPFRIHLVSGKTLDVNRITNVALLQNALLILGAPVDAENEGDYNIVSLRNIERRERLESAPD
jgi:hypothetical protein